MKPKEEEYIFYQANGYMKKSQKVSKRDLERAKTMKKDYIFRVKGGVYYEKS